MKSKKLTYNQLLQKVKELRAELPISYTMANSTIDKASVDKLMASGVMLQLTGIGGREIIEPIIIRDGLSKETIDAIKADIKRSFAIATLSNNDLTKG